MDMKVCKRASKDLNASLQGLENVLKDIGKGPGRVQVSFAQGRGEGAGNVAYIAGRNGMTYQNIRCYSCNKSGHYSDQCTREDENENGVNTNKIKLAHVHRTTDPHKQCSKSQSTLHPSVQAISQIVRTRIVATRSVFCFSFERFMLPTDVTDNRTHKYTNVKSTSMAW